MNIYNNSQIYSIMSSILKTIDLNAQYANSGLGSLTPSAVKEDIQQILEQYVNIDAEFPNAKDHYEIEEAFNNLLNTASQYANRKS